MRNGSFESWRFSLLILGSVALFSLGTGLHSRSRRWTLRIWARLQGAIDSGPLQAYTWAMFHSAIRTCLVITLLILAAGRSFAAGTEKWTEVRSPDFLVLTDSNEKQGRWIALQFELIRAVFRQFFKIPGTAKDPVVTIIAVKNKEGLKRLMPEEGLSHPATVYVAGPEKDYIALRLDVANVSRWDDPYENVHHGYIHLLARRLISQLPLWMLEGLAEFYGNTSVEGRTIFVGAPSLTNLKVLDRNKLLPLGALFAVDASSPYYHEEDRASIFYAQSWLLTHYLITRDWREGTHRVRDFVSLLGQSVKPEEAARRTIGDPVRLQEELQHYLRGHHYPAAELPMPSSLDANDFTAEPASPAESLAVRAEFMALGGNYAEAQKMVEKALRLEPKLVAAQESMRFISAAEYAAAMAKARDGRRDATARLPMARQQQKHQKKMKESEMSAHRDHSEHPEPEPTPKMPEPTTEKDVRDTQGGKMAVSSKAVEVPSPTASPAPPPVVPSGPPVGSGSKGGEVAALSKTTEVPSQTAPPLESELVAPADEPFFEAYRRSDPITKWPLKKVLHQIPELKGLKPATDQSRLPEILRGVSANVQKFVVNFVDITALETIKGTGNWQFAGKPARKVEKFRYLMLARREGSAFTLVEYRTDMRGREEHPQIQTGDLIKTTGFASMALFFGPLEQPWSDFRYLGQQTIGGDRTEAVAFAEHIEPVEVMGRLEIGKASMPILVQGVAWIRSSDYQILKMRTDLLAPLPPLKRMTTLVLYAKNEFEGRPTALWLPQDVKVTVGMGHFVFGNRHMYSDYRMFRVESVIKPDTGMAQQH